MNENTRKTKVTVGTKYLSLPSGPEAQSPGSSESAPPLSPRQIQFPEQVAEVPAIPVVPIPVVLTARLVIQQPYIKFCTYSLVYSVLGVTLIFPLLELHDLRFLQRLDLVLYQLLCFFGICCLHFGYHKELDFTQRALYHRIPSHLIYMLYGVVCLFVLYFILVTIFHLYYESALKNNLTQALMASVRSLVYHGSLGSICFIHAQESVWIVALGLQLQHDTYPNFPKDGWNKLLDYQTNKIKKYNKLSGNVVSIALLFYFAAAASSCLSLCMYDGGARYLLIVLIICAGTVIYMVTFFSAAVSAEGKRLTRPLYYKLKDTLHSRLDHCEFQSEIGGFGVSTTGFLRSLLGLGAFVFALVPLASWLQE